MLNIENIREDFPILSTKVYGHPLVYLDNAATTQKPSCVIEAGWKQYLTLNANVHRGVHYLSEKATELMEQSRESVRRFINAASTSEIIFTRGTTESINLVAHSFGSLLKEGDEVIISSMEHHSNIVPWQLLRNRTGIRLRVIPMDDNGILRQEDYRALFNEKTRLVSIAHVSNVLGTVNPVREMIQYAHEQGVPVLIDGAQSVPHFKTDVHELDCDFLAFSAHKMYGPTGVGILYGKEKWLEKMPPWQGGGEMISTVSFEKTVFERLPYKFEAGTPNYIGNSTLRHAIEYIEKLGIDNIQAYEKELTDYAMQKMSQIDGIRLFGTAPEKEAVISFLVRDIHHLDMGTLLDRLGIAVRTGHHCAQPVMTRFGIEGTVRASFSFYNTKAEIDQLCEGINRVTRMF